MRREIISAALASQARGMARQLSDQQLDLISTNVDELVRMRGEGLTDDVVRRRLRRQDAARDKLYGRPAAWRFLREGADERQRMGQSSESSAADEIPTWLTLPYDHPRARYLAVDSERNGSCFYSSVAMALAHKRLSGGEQMRENIIIRERALDYYLEHEADFAAAYTEDVPKEDESEIRNHVGAFLNTSQWAFNQQIAAVALKFRLRILILIYTNEVYEHMTRRSAKPVSFRVLMDATKQPGGDGVPIFHFLWYNDEPAKYDQTIVLMGNRSHFGAAVRLL